MYKGVEGYLGTLSYPLIVSSKENHPKISKKQVFFQLFFMPSCAREARLLPTQKNFFEWVITSQEKT